MEIHRDETNGRVGCVFYELDITCQFGCRECRTAKYQCVQSATYVTSVTSTACRITMGGHEGTCTLQSKPFSVELSV